MILDKSISGSIIQAKFVNVLNNKKKFFLRRPDDFVMSQFLIAVVVEEIDFFYLGS